MRTERRGAAGQGAKIGGDGKEEVVVVGDYDCSRLRAGVGRWGHEFLPSLLQQREYWVLSRGARAAVIVGVLFLVPLL